MGIAVAGRDAKSAADSAATGPASTQRLSCNHAQPQTNTVRDQLGTVKLHWVPTLAISALHGEGLMMP